MQSDQKIGLCLLIALCGFAAALGFGRREHPINPPTLRDELTSADELRPVDETDGSEIDRATEAAPKVKIELVEQATTETVRGEAALAFDPMFAPRIPVATAQAEPRTSIDSPADLQNHTSDATANGRQADSRQARFREYVVQSGDTLSGIASRELNDVRRYIDVFEANRDLLAHPDALRVGQTLRIPLPARSAMQTANANERDIR